MRVIEENSFDKKILILAASYGGSIAIPFAVKYSKMVKKMLLVVSGHALSDSGIRFCKECVELAEQENQFGLLMKMQELYNDITWIQKLKFNIQVMAYWKCCKKKLNSVSVLKNAYQTMIRDNDIREQYLKGIEAETLVIAGGKDMLFTREIYEETANLIPNDMGMHCIKPEGGHMFSIKKENKEWFSKAVEGFFSGETTCPRNSHSIESVENEL